MVQNGWYHHIGWAQIWKTAINIIKNAYSLMHIIITELLTGQKRGSDCYHRKVNREAEQYLNDLKDDKYALLALIFDDLEPITFGC